MQGVTPSTRYFPRDHRCGVRSNTRLVSGRTRGPMNGRHPMVNVMAAARSTARQATTVRTIFMKRFTVRSS